MSQKDPTNHLGLNDGRWHEVQSHHAGLSAPDYEFRERPGKPFVREIRDVAARKRAIDVEERGWT
ncbi:hypothetical protein GCM10007866_14010 [Gluconobacter albidus]|uniref:Uncharacterized protein n=1 Tax=Gluconobacter albidus TaxID=318683 RepID=A0ABQ5X0R1_9PROT|nr:hypothetical protein [Gluconobacter albidus]GLQ68950.1 hypothetical protein GCM10007866_14010 [Gluconobacter albidus]